MKVLDLPFVTRRAFEGAMSQFVALCFPDAGLFDLRAEQGLLWLTEAQPADSLVG
jgi:hypothetical protein